MAPVAPRADQIQALLFGSMKRLPHAALVMGRFRLPPREALADLLPRVAFGPLPAGAATALQVALTPAGLAALGVPGEALPYAFRDPLGSDHHRRVLGDEGPSAPETWAWSGDDAHLAVLAYAADASSLDALLGSLAAFERVHTLQTTMLDDDREHFGFRDGLSRVTWQGEAADTPAGEIVLGYPDATGELPPSPAHAGLDLGRDGSFLVVRQLAQDVRGFWDALRARDPDPVRLGGKLIGRTVDGELLAPGPGFAADPHGLQCPRGAHIRRAAPQDALATPTSPGPDPRRHRLLRRGRAYGPPAPPEVFPEGVRVTAGATPPDADAERGLLFVCLCADLARQFELVQQSWLNNPRHDGLHDEICPISSAHGTPGDDRRFTVPGDPVRTRLHDWPTVVRVRGSAYALLMGRAALEGLARG